MLNRIGWERAFANRAVRACRASGSFVDGFWLVMQLMWDANGDPVLSCRSMFCKLFD